MNSLKLAKLQSMLSKKKLAPSRNFGCIDKNLNKKVKIHITDKEFYKKKEEEKEMNLLTKEEIDYLEKLENEFQFEGNEMKIEDEKEQMYKQKQFEKELPSGIRKCKTGFFNCPYCKESYTYWSKHSLICNPEMSEIKYDKAKKRVMTDAQKKKEEENQFIKELNDLFYPTSVQ